MTCGNEEGRYLEMVVEDLFRRDLIDELIIVLDAPTDKTPEICRELAEKYPITVYHHKFKLFGTAQNELRKRLINYGISKNPYGFLTPDADEIFEEAFDRKAIYNLLKQKPMGWDFRIAHFWGDFEHVRIDGTWKNQKNIRLFKYMKDRSQDFAPKAIHCGSGPSYAYKNRAMSPYLFKHYGYVRPKDVRAKSERYAKYDPSGIYESPSWYRGFDKEGDIVKYNRKIYAN